MPVIAPVAVAGLLLAARTLAGTVDLPSPRASDIIEATGATRSRAYELKEELLGALSGFVRPVGRPPKPEEPSLDNAETRALLAIEVVRFLAAHPGSMQSGEHQNFYSDEFRRLVLELRERHRDVDLDFIAECTFVPRGTLNDWLRPGGRAREPDTRGEPETAPREPTLARIETLLAAWDSWRGNFTCFCQHVRRDLRLEYGDSMIGRLLREHGARSPTRRPGRTPDEEALRGQFETFFGGAQWVGDGKELVAVINGEEHHFNLELLVDAHSSAWVGLDVRDQEDSAAVVGAFAAGVQTTGAPPLATLLDNKPSNHTSVVDAALGETMRIRATPFRPQNKAHVEGAFGLFSQALPPVNLSTRDAHELGGHVLFLLAWAFAVGLNHRPRRDRQGRSRVDLYQEPVSDEERALAKERLRQRLHKQEAARRARHARADPGLRALLDEAFDRLRLDDPERHFRDAIALHRPDFIVNAIAIFDGKDRAGTLPDGADARYLLGIVKNLEHVHEATYITQAIIETRLAARDHFLAPLVARREQLASPSAPIKSILRAYVDALVDSERVIDRHFWTHSIAAVLAEQPAEDQPRLLQAVARRIHASFRLALRDREAAALLISRRLWPLE